MTTALSGPTIVTVWDKSNKLGTAEVKPDGSWNFPTPVLGTGEHIFRATVNELQSASRTVVVQSEAIVLRFPHFINATASGPGSENINYYEYPRDGIVEVTDYGMKTGDTVMVTWKGRNSTVKTEIQTVGNPPRPLNFTISKYELIDCINSQATIFYSVKRPPSEEKHLSPELKLTVSGHNFNLLAPSLAAGNSELIVHRQDNFVTNSTARVRAIGNGSWESDSAVFENNQQLKFPIDSQWLSANKGKAVLFNWSLKFNRGDQQLYFSQMLRVGSL